MTTLIEAYETPIRDMYRIYRINSNGHNGFCFRIRHGDSFEEVDSTWMLLSDAENRVKEITKHICLTMDDR